MGISVRNNNLGSSGRRVEDILDRGELHVRFGKASQKFRKTNAIRGKLKPCTLILAFVIAAFSMSGPVKAQTTDLVPRGNEQPSFDCSRAKTATARLICADLELTRLDRELITAFLKQKLQVYVPDQPRFVTDELAWIRERNERCGLVGKNDATIEMLANSKSCLIAAIQERIAFLEEQQAATESRKVERSQMAAPPNAQSSQPQTNWPDPQQTIRAQSRPSVAAKQREQQVAIPTKLELAKQQGYRQVSVEDFKLDGKQLSGTNARLILQGFYSKSGDIEILQQSGLAVAIARRYGNGDGVPLLTDTATRDVRKYFLECASNPLAQLGCPITLVGHADMCSATSLLESKSVPCLVVEDGW